MTSRGRETQNMKMNTSAPSAASTPSVTFPRRTSSGRYVRYSREDIDDSISGEISGNYSHDTVTIPPTPDNQPMHTNGGAVDPSIISKAEEQYVSNSIFTGGFNSVTRAHLMQMKVVGAGAGAEKGNGSSCCAMNGCDGKMMRNARGEDVLPCECNFKICADCYFDAIGIGGICPGCKEPYKVDLDEGRLEAVPLPQLPAPKTLERRMSLAESNNSKSILLRSQTGDFDHNRWLFETNGTYGYGNAFWPKEDPFSTGNGMPGTTPDLNDKSWKPLTRKMKIPPAILSPYRLLVFVRIAALAVFLYWRVTHPNNKAIWLWGMSIVCEIWFAFSWLLDQLPKLCPINRSTDLTVLKEKFERAGPSNPSGKSDLPGIDVFVSTADPEKEPPLVTANTILSILGGEYPVEKLACYVSDDGGALLTFEGMAEAASFAELWVPFCRKHNIEPRNPESYFNTKGDPTKNKVRQDFVKDRRRLKREYDEFKVRINGLPESVRRRSDAYNAKEEIKVMKLETQNSTGKSTETLEKEKVVKATWMSDGTHWPGTWIVSRKEHPRR